MENERWLVYLFVQMEKKNQVSNTYFKLAAILLYGCLMGMQKRKLLLNQSFHYKNTQVFWEKNKSDEKKGKKKKTNHITNSQMCSHRKPTLSTEQSVSLAGWLAVVHSLQGRWNSEAGRGVQCVVSKFCMYFRAWRLKERDGRWRRHWDKGVGGGEWKGQSLITLDSLCLLWKQTNLSHLSRVYMAGK